MSENIEQTTETTSAAATTQATSLLASVNPQTTESVATTQVDSTPVTKFSELLSEDGKFINDWTNKLPEGFKDSAKTLSKFKDPSALIASYVSLEKEFSKRTTPAKIPGETATPEEWTSYKQAIGAPDKKEAYGLNKPDNIPDTQWNAELADKSTEIALKYGIPVKAMHELVDVYNGNMQTLVKQAETIQAKQYEETLNTVKKEWGADFNNKLQQANRAANAIGLDINDPTIGNNISIIKALLNVESFIKEDKGINTSNSTAQTYKEAYNKLLVSDEYQGKKGIDEQMAAQTRLKQLYKAMQGE